ncbi:MAG TPA: hypothetical protein H9902_11505 [Candidatus Stackebrandtia faecavium]|nr:hypothetical protein [Candidatus Stackebrandtia faecavium]
MNTEEPRLEIVKTRTERVRDAVARLRPYRGRIKLGLVAVVVLIIAGFIAIPKLFPKEVGLVDDYLSVLQDGDAQAAIDIADGGKAERSFKTFNRDNPIAYDPSFLTSDALRTDWEYHSLELGAPERGPQCDCTPVYATLADGDTEVLSRFDVGTDEDGQWLIQPYAQTDFSGLDTNPVTIDKATHAIEFGNEVEPYLVFPGTHVFAEASEVYEPNEEDSRVLWTAGGSNFSPPGADLRKDMRTKLRDAFTEYLDECAESSDVFPQHCPFRAASHADDDYVSTAQNAYVGLKDVQWRIESEPTVHFIADTQINWVTGEYDPINGVVEEPGEAVITAKTAEGESVDATCAISGQIWARVDADTQIKFTAESDTGSSTQCRENT